MDGTDIAVSIQTPGGIGKLVDADTAAEKLIVEMDWSYQVEFEAEECFI